MASVNFRTRLFFDRDVVIRMMDKQTHAAMKKSGLAIRRNALRIVKEVSNPRDYSSPGQPAHAHMRAKIKLWNKRRKARGQAPIKRNKLLGIRQITSEYEPEIKQAVIGPVGYRYPGVPVPRKLTFGGFVRAGSAKKPLQARIEPRPFMQPALAEERPFMPSRFGGDVRG